MSTDPQEWARGQVPDPANGPTAPIGQPVAPYAPVGTNQPYDRPAVTAVPAARDPYAYDPDAQPAPRPATPPATYTPGYGQSASPQPPYPPAGYPQSGPAPYPQGPNPQPYVEGAYGQRSAYGEYAPTSYGAGGYQPMPFAALPPLAGFGARVGASLIDGVVPGLLSLAGVVVLFTTLTPAAAVSGLPASYEPSGQGLLTLAVTYLLGGLFSLWNRTFRQGRTGQSIGKSVLGIRLVSEKTMAPPGPLLAFGREIAHYVDSAIYVGYLWPLWDAKNQTLADKICSTVVIADG